MGRDTVPNAMDGGQGTVRFVVSSRVRTAVLREMGAEEPTTEELLEGIDASSSAVYNALSSLEEHGLVWRKDRWQLTGAGRLIADLVADHAARERLFEQTGDYFARHDTTVLPARFRRRICELDDVTLVEGTETEPQRAVQEVVERIERAKAPLVVSPIYIASYEEAMPNAASSRVILSTDLASEADPDDTEEEELDLVDIRIADVEFALGVTDSELLLSLPTPDGEYDAQSELVAESESARKWGRELFEFLWERGKAPEEVLDDY